MYSLNTLIAVVIVTALAAGGVVWLTQTIGQLRARLTEQAQQIEALRQEQAKPLPVAVREWAANRDLDHRAQLLSVAALVKLSARDSLDALQRVSPEMALEVIGDVAPQLIKKENLK